MAFLQPDIPDEVVEGPRLDELRVSDSAYGNDIPSGFGTAKLSGNIIWSSALEEEKVVDRTEYGGKGGGGQTVTNISYNYYLSFAICFSRRRAYNLRRIWANNKLLIDTTDPLNQGVNEQFIWRFYDGTETQEPDPLLIAEEGAAIPGHRGLCYLVCERWPLGEFGNSVPSLTAEINFENLDTSDWINTIVYSGAKIDTNQTLRHVIDWNRNILYMCGPSYEYTAYDMSDFSLISTCTFTDFPYVGLDQVTGKIFTIQTNSNGYIVDPIADVEDTFAFTFTNYGLAKTVMMVSKIDYTTLTVVGAVYGDTGGDIRTEIRSTGGGQLIYSERYDSAYDYYHFATMYNGVGLAAFGHVDTTNNLINLRTVQITHYIEGTSQVAWGQVTELTALTPSDIDSSAVSFPGSFLNTGFLTFDQESADLYFDITTDTGVFIVRYDPLSESVLWATEVSTVLTTNSTSDHYYISGNYFAFHTYATPQVYKLNAENGQIIPPFDGVTASLGYGAGMVWYNDRTDAAGNAINIGYDFVTHELGGTSKTADIDNIIDYVTEQVGLNKVGDSNTNNLTDSIGGYAANKIITANTVADQLAQLFNFDVVERDGYLTYVYRGGASAVTIPENDFIWKGRGKTNHYIERRVQEAELPYEYSIKYKDQLQDFNENVVTVSRIINPNKTVLSRNKTTLSLPIILNADDIKQQAEKLLYQEWIARTQFEFQLAQKYLYLDPTDVVTITLNNGLSVDCSMFVGDIGADFTTKITAKQQRTGQYSSTITADNGEFIGQSVGSLSFSQFFVIDSPFLRDFDNVNGSSHLVYHAANKYAGGTTWPGEVLQQTRDGTSWVEVDRINLGSPWGICSSTLGNPASYWRTDTTNTLDVNMIADGDELSSVTYEQMLNGANAAFILKADGEVGIIQFQTVTSLGDNVYRLSNLLRGRRGTNTMDKDYLGSEYFVLISSSYMSAFQIQLDDRSQPISYRGFTAGAMQELGIIKQLTHQGRDLKPYSPVHLTATVDGSNNIDFDWQRRSRLGGEVDLADGGDGTITIAEASEAYELDIYFGGSIIRTVTGITSSDYEYTAADQTTDGFAPGSVSTIQVDVYQISDTVGRGFAGEFNIEVN